MAYLFSYTECEAPGPFNAKAGFKIKSLSLIGIETADLGIERILNLTIANFPAYQAPKVDAYATSQDFTSLPKVWSFIPIFDGHLAFVRLATSGAKMGRPGNPFHQALVTKFQEIPSLISLGTNQGLDHLTPADMFFWDWPNPRGDAEVEAAFYEAGTAPIPRTSELELSEAWEQVFSSPAGLASTRQFESKFLTSSSRQLQMPETDYFALLSLLFRLIPLEYSWVTPFSNQSTTRLPKDFDPEAHPALSLDTAGNPQVSEQSVFWSDLVELIVENGLPIEAIRFVQALSKVFDFSLSSQRQALVFLPLAILVMEDHHGLLHEQGLRTAAWQVLQDLSIRMQFKSGNAKHDFYNDFLSKIDLSTLPPAAEEWLKKIEARP
jgi:hypothetical protein